MFVFLLMLGCAERAPSSHSVEDYSTFEQNFDLWEEEWLEVENEWSKAELSKEERLETHQKLERIYFDRIVVHQKPLHRLDPSALLAVEYAFGRMFYDIKRRSSRKISEKTVGTRKEEIRKLEEQSRLLFELLRPKTPRSIELEGAAEGLQLSEAAEQAEVSSAEAPKLKEAIDSSEKKRSAE
jgi:hypothetical protein